jgi:hypothetical protein
VSRLQRRIKTSERSRSSRFSPDTLQIVLDPTTRDSYPPTYHVEIRVPRSQSFVRASEFRSYYSFTRHTGSWTSLQRTLPLYGYVLLTTDTRGDVLEVRIVEIEDKHDYVPSGVNGIYRVKMP